MNDNLEIAVNFYSLRGIIDVTSIRWLDPVLYDTPADNTLNYQRDKQMLNEEDKSTKLVADLSRVCELEDSQQEWRFPTYDTLPKGSLDFLKKFRSCFMVKEVEFAHVDILVLKVQLLATRKGEIPYNKMLGIGVKVMDYDAECTNEVKKVGLLIERHCDLELRVGDLVVLYLSKSSITTNNSNNNSISKK